MGEKAPSNNFVDETYLHLHRPGGVQPPMAPPPQLSFQLSFQMEIRDRGGGPERLGSMKNLLQFQNPL